MTSGEALFKANSSSSSGSMSFVRLKSSKYYELYLKVDAIIKCYLCLMWEIKFDKELSSLSTLYLKNLLRMFSFLI